MERNSSYVTLASLVSCIHIGLRELGKQALRMMLEQRGILIDLVLFISLHSGHMSVPLRYPSTYYSLILNLAMSMLANIVIT